MSKNKYNIAIIGAGCSGLNLVWELSKLNLQYHCSIFEKRKFFHNDKTWCFWLSYDEKFDHRDIISNSWQKWSFSKKNEHYLCSHNSTAYSYNYIKSENFYKKMLNLINKDERFELFLNHEIKLLNSLKGFDLLIDTRPYSKKEIQKKASIFQIFYGLKVQTKNYEFDLSGVSLMESLSSNSKECEFIYILPMSRNLALIELTIFSNEISNPDALEFKLLDYVRKLDSQFIILEKEKNILPMGLNHKLDIKKDVIIGGMAANNLKSVSGYGFLRTIKWAKNTTYMIEKDFTVEKINKLNSSMFKDNLIDKIFLKVMQNSMVFAAEIFRSLGEKMPSDSFARIMTDKATLRDKLILINSVPKMPFIKEVFKYVFKN